MITINVLWFFKTEADGKNTPKYRKVILMDNRNFTIFTSETGDLVRDWYFAVTHYINNYSNAHELSYDNNINSFLASVGTYRGVYITNDILGDMVLVTPDVFWETGVEEVLMFLVPRDNQKTWEELKEYCA